MFEHLSRYFITDSKCTYIHQMKNELAIIQASETKLAINSPATTAPNDEKPNAGQIIYCKLFSRNILCLCRTHYKVSNFLRAQIDPKCIFSKSGVFSALFTMSRRPQTWPWRPGESRPCRSQQKAESKCYYRFRVQKYSATNVGKVAILTKVNTKTDITAIRV